jgi:acetolactate synthase-1/3 small subunit
MKHVISALVQNQPGVLAQVSGMLASRGFNIDSLVVGETDRHDMSRMTFVVNGDDKVLDQVRKQLEKIITVVKVQDYSGGLDFVERDLALIKVDCTPANRFELFQIVEVFRARIVDIGPGHVMIEMSGREAKIEAFIEQCRPFGIRELARTGTIAMPRGIGTSTLENSVLEKTGT